MHSLLPPGIVRYRTNVDVSGKVSQWLTTSASILPSRYHASLITIFVDSPMTVLTISFLQYRRTLIFLFFFGRGLITFLACRRNTKTFVRCSRCLRPCLIRRQSVFETRRSRRSAERASHVNHLQYRINSLKLHNFNAFRVRN